MKYSDEIIQEAKNVLAGKIPYSNIFKPEVRKIVEEMSMCAAIGLCVGTKKHRSGTCGGVHGIPEGFYSVNETEKLTKYSSSQLRRMDSVGILKPKRVLCGQYYYRAYSEEDIAILRQFKANPVKRRIASLMNGLAKLYEKKFGIKITSKGILPKFNDRGLESVEILLKYEKYNNKNTEYLVVQNERRNKAK